MVTEDAQVPWSSLSLVGRTASNQTLWKMFSREPLPHAWQEILFEKGFLVVVEKIWSSPGAYPMYVLLMAFALVQLIAWALPHLFTMPAG